MGRISNIVIADSGEQYLGVPTVSISLPDGDSAVATATLTIVNGIVTGTSVTSPGTFYTSSSVVALSDATYLPKKKAAATTTLASYKGGISSITLDSGGSYYNVISGENVVLIDSPLSVIPVWYRYVSLSSQYGVANKFPAILNTLNPQQSNGTLKFQHYARSNTLLNDSGNFAATNLIGTDNFRLQWADSNKINFDIRSSIDSSWQNIFTNRPIQLNQLELNGIEFSWDSDNRFMLWIDSALEYSTFITDSGLANQLFSNDGVITIGDSNSVQLFDKVYFYSDVSDSNSFASNIIFSELFNLEELVTATASITKDSHGHINSIIIIDSGSGYYSIPSVEFSNPDGTESDWPTALTTNIENGEIISLNIVQNGGVLDSANITIGLPLGARESFRATAVANYDEITSKISSVRMIDSGNFYVSPTVTIGLSPIAATSDFIIGDTVYEDLPSGVRIQGEVTKWIESAGQVYLAHVGANDGNLHTFTVDGRLISTRLTNLKPAVNRLISGVAENNQISNTEQNDYFDSLTDFLDFSETNPFGEPS